MENTPSNLHKKDSTRAILNRLAKASGHLESVRRMVEEGRDTAEVLNQLSAVRAALGSTGKLIFTEEMEKALDEAIQTGNYERVHQLNASIGRFIK
jgi:DNA-binding FrmR family transcriptional regulator